MDSLQMKWASVRDRIKERDGACVFCGATTGLSVDHIVPREWRGQINGDANLRTLCTRCHNKKYGAESNLVKEVMQERISVAEARRRIALWNPNPEQQHGGTHECETQV